MSSRDAVPETAAPRSAERDPVGLRGGAAGPLSDTDRDEVFGGLHRVAAELVLEDLDRLAGDLSNVEDRIGTLRFRLSEQAAGLHRTFTVLRTPDPPPPSRAERLRAAVERPSAGSQRRDEEHCGRTPQSPRRICSPPTSAPPPTRSAVSPSGPPSVAGSTGRPEPSGTPSEPSAPERPVPLGVAVLAAALVSIAALTPVTGTATGTDVATAQGPRTTPEPDFVTVPPVPVGQVGREEAVAAPTGLSIPVIGLDVRGLVNLDLDDRGRLGAPTDFATVGWYRDGVAPGARGPAVLVGHVDSVAGPLRCSSGCATSGPGTGSRCLPPTVR